MAVSSDTTGASVARRPKLIVMGAIRSRVVRGPRADGRWYWRAEVYDSGASTTVWTGWATPAEMPALLAPLAARPDGARPRLLTNVKTVQDLLEHWCTAQSERPDLRPASVTAYIGCGNRLVDEIGDVRLDRLTVETLADYRDRRGRLGGSGRTTALDLNVLRMAWRWGRERGVVADELPRLRLRPDRKTRPSHRTPEPEEIDRMLSALEGHNRPVAPWRIVALRVLWSTGMRAGEVAALTWADVDLTTNSLNVNGKTGPRRVPMSPTLRSVLISWRLRCGSSTRVFRAAETRTMFFHGIRKAILLGCRLLGVQAWSPHALRRAAVVALCRAGVDVAVAARVTGHSPEILLRHYRQVADAEITEAVARAGLGTVPAQSTRTRPGTAG